MGMDEGFKATEDFVAAAGRVRGLMADGRVARREVEQVRVAARRALGEAARLLGRVRVVAAADAAEATDRGLDAARIRQAHTNVAIGHLRRELTALRDEAANASVTAKSPAERTLEQALRQAKLEQTVKLAELLLSKEDFDALVEAMGLHRWAV